MNLLSSFEFRMGQKCEIGNLLKSAYDWYRKSAGHGNRDAKQRLGDVVHPPSDKFLIPGPSNEQGSYARFLFSCGQKAELKGIWNTAYDLYLQSINLGLHPLRSILSEPEFRLGWEAERKEDFCAAYDWYLKAVEHGHPYAKQHLASIEYRFGREEENKAHWISALNWYTDAVEHGHSEAKIRQDIVREPARLSREKQPKIFHVNPFHNDTPGLVDD